MKRKTFKKIKAAFIAGGKAAIKIANGYESDSQDMHDLADVYIDKTYNIMCVITNEASNWSIEVDGKKRYFSGQENAEHLVDLYKRLGYTILYNDII